MTALTISSYSHARLERKLDLLISEINSGKREGSVISYQTIDALESNEELVWADLRRELEDMGLSTTLLIEYRQFIVRFFQAAIASGKLQEVASRQSEVVTETGCHPSAPITDSNANAAFVNETTLAHQRLSQDSESLEQDLPSPLEDIADTSAGAADHQRLPESSEQTLVAAQSLKAIGYFPLSNGVARQKEATCGDYAEDVLQDPTNPQAATTDFDIKTGVATHQGSSRSWAMPRQALPWPLMNVGKTFRQTIAYHPPAESDESMPVTPIINQYLTPQIGLDEGQDDAYQMGMLLVFAASHGNQRWAKKILDERPNTRLDSRNEAGFTALHFAATQG